MKIAIITLPLHTNYGGLLQAFALKSTLEGMGHEVTVIDVKDKMPLPKDKKAIMKPENKDQKVVVKPVAK